MVTNETLCTQQHHSVLIFCLFLPLSLLFLLRYQLYADASAGFIAYPDDFLFRSDRLISEARVVSGPIIATTMEASDLAEPVVIKIKEQPNADSNDIFQKVFKLILTVVM